MIAMTIGYILIIIAVIFFAQELIIKSHVAGGRSKRTKYFTRSIALNMGLRSAIGKLLA